MSAIGPTELLLILFLLLVLVGIGTVAIAVALLGRKRFGGNRTGSAALQSEVTAQLTQLASLHASGSLTGSEFEAAKFAALKGH